MHSFPPHGWAHFPRILPTLMLESVALLEALLGLQDRVSLAVEAEGFSTIHHPIAFVEKLEFEWKEEKVEEEEEE